MKNEFNDILIKAGTKQPNISILTNNYTSTRASQSVAASDQPPPFAPIVSSNIPHCSSNTLFRIQYWVFSICKRTFASSTWSLHQLSPQLAAEKVRPSRQKSCVWAIQLTKGGSSPPVEAYSGAIVTILESSLLAPRKSPLQSCWISPAFGPRTGTWRSSAGKRQLPGSRCPSSPYTPLPCRFAGSRSTASQSASANSRTTSKSQSRRAWTAHICIRARFELEYSPFLYPYGKFASCEGKKAHLKSGNKHQLSKLLGMLSTCLLSIAPACHNRHTP